VTTLILIAKETVPGKVKTRLHPPLSLEQAATLAAASITDTLAAVAALPATRRILAFDGEMLPPGSEDYEVIPQVAPAGSFAATLAGFGLRFLVGAAS
jgi:2-phospho-L-lactate guanylyltransferase (CobY/MobA/RfbA family)